MMMPSHESDPRLRWITVTGPLAWCPTCPTGAFGYNGDSDPGRTARRAIAAARRHARETGHTVIVERGQTLRVEPGAE